MLVLERRENERILLKFGDIVAVLTVFDLHRSGVKVGIEAPGEICILREEVAKRQIQRTGAKHEFQRLEGRS